MLLYLTTISARSSSADEMLCVLKGQNTNLKYPSVFLICQSSDIGVWTQSARKGFTICEQNRTNLIRQYFMSGVKILCMMK